MTVFSPPSSPANSLSKKLQKHRTIRRLLSQNEHDPSPEGIDEDARKELNIQHRVSIALSRYITAVAAACEALFNAQVALDEGGIGELVEAAPVAAGLLEGLRQAQELTQQLAAAMGVPLDIHSRTVVACLDDVNKADEAEAELRWYSQKVESMEDGDVMDNEKTGDKSNSKTEARLQRNKDKLKKVQHSSSISQLRAHDSVGKCVLRRANLEELAREAVRITAEALRGAAPVTAWQQATPNPFNPFDCEADGDPEATMSGMSPFKDECMDNSTNPFSSDIGEHSPPTSIIGRRSEAMDMPMVPMVHGKLQDTDSVKHTESTDPSVIILDERPSYYAC
eukprot:CAMPEP_0197933136 /NCGR_PEP_ID=MMETSP1439-20131203/109651_1 /TAXON_ID=66791 /ORGANISM="Gonyaulax spinifera, Strain CCMP409" /LENGTH=337 /DNA_ID=CAMNT_0043555951 /DNA_START=31 /DNA_END=1041 /DNA_ORIENTATION=+